MVRPVQDEMGQHYRGSHRLPGQDPGGADRADALWNELDCSVTIQLLQFVGLDGNPDWAVARGGDNAITILTQSERILR